MKLTFLGTGTSIGVPCIGCQCETCQSDDPRDKRLRTSALLETDGGLRILIDCGPDFRQQILPHFGKLDAVLFTHIHYDHVGGADDLRPFSHFGNVDIYAQKDVVEGLKSTMPYCFKESLYPGVPHLSLHAIEAGKPFVVSRDHEILVDFPPSGSTLRGTLIQEGRRIVIPKVEEKFAITPIRVMHGKLPILGFRMGSLAYITDMKSMPEESLPLLDGVKVLVVNALRFEKTHHSHQLVDDAILLAQKVKAEKTYLIHLTHDIGTHSQANKRLPEGVEFAYDGQVLNVVC